MKMKHAAVTDLLDRLRTAVESAACSKGVVAE